VILKIFGAFLVVSGCGAFALIIAISHKRDADMLKQIIQTLEYAKLDLQYRMESLPQVFKKLSSREIGLLSKIYFQFSMELNNRKLNNPQQCMLTVLKKFKNIPRKSVKVLELLGYCLGTLGIEGQEKTLQSVITQAELILEEHMSEYKEKIRSYQTLALSAGAALAILFM